MSDCGGGDRVGGADDGAENEAEAEVEAGKNPVRDGGDAANGEDDETEGEHGDADEVVAEVAPGGGESGGEQERRKDYQENHIWIQGDVRHAGKEAEDEAADDENDGVGRLETLCESGQARDEEQEEEKNKFDAVDAGCLHGLGGLKITARRRGDKETERKAHDEGRVVVAAPVQCVLAERGLFLGGFWFAEEGALGEDFEGAGEALLANLGRFGGEPAEELHASRPQ